MSGPRAELLGAWQGQRRRRLAMVAIGTALLLALVVVSLAAGASAIGPARIVRAGAGWIIGEQTDLSAMDLDVVRDLRLPRTLMAVMAGAGLSIAGAAMQGLTRNVLVSPYTLGISPAAALGASAAILLGSGTKPWLTVLSAFGMALACAAIVLGLAALRGVRPTVLVLAGIGLTYLFGALTATMQFLGTEQQLSAIVHWTFGSFNGTSWTDVAITATVLATTLPALVLHGQALNAFAGGGDELASSLGFAVTRIRLLVTILAALTTATIVSFAGVIGFVGLVAPHIARLAIGADHKALLPFSLVVGGLLVLSADLVGRVAFSPVVVPVGIVVAYIGVPIFLHLLLTRRETGED